MDGVVRKEPLTQRQVLVALESLYDLVLDIEQLRRDQPFEEDEEAIVMWYVLICVMISMSHHSILDGHAGKCSMKTSSSKYGLG
jgi:hypothetical protein